MITVLYFRIPELESIATLFKLNIQLTDASPDLTRPYLVAQFDDEESVKRYASRAILLKAAIEIWAEGTHYDAVHAVLRTRLNVLAPFKTHSFAFRFHHANHVIQQARKHRIVDDFAYMSTGPDGLQGSIDLKNPELEIGLFEYHAPLRKAGAEEDELRRLEYVYIGRQLCIGQRHLVDRFDVKRRSYIGNTTMEAEVSLLMANQTLSAPGKMIYDPFVGTGSMLYVCAAFGAMVMGSDMDGRMIRGHEEGKNIWSSAAQYGVAQRIVDCLTFDLSQHPWRLAGVFDAIVTDRAAGAKQLGRYKPPRVVDPARIVQRERPWEDPIHNLAPTKPWELKDVLTTLLDLSFYLLKPSGRLVYFLPVATDTLTLIPTHPGLRLISDSPQNFGKWERRLITMERLTDEEASVASATESSVVDVESFRRRYFAAFAKISRQNPVKSSGPAAAPSVAS